MAYGDVFTQLTTDPMIQPFLPFLFVLAIVYGMLTITGIFKTKDGRPMNSVNFIIALVFAFFAAGYAPFVNFFFANFGAVLWAFIILFFIAFILEVVGLRRKKVPKGKEDVPIMMGGIIILLLVTVGFTYISDLEIPIIGAQNFMVIIGLVLLMLVLYYAYELGLTRGK